MPLFSRFFPPPEGRGGGAERETRVAGAGGGTRSGSRPIMMRGWGGRRGECGAEPMGSCVGRGLRGQGRGWRSRGRNAVGDGSCPGRVVGRALKGISAALLRVGRGGRPLRYSRRGFSPPGACFPLRAAVRNVPAEAQQRTRLLSGERLPPPRSPLIYSPLPAWLLTFWSLPHHQLPPLPLFFPLR